MKNTFKCVYERIRIQTCTNPITEIKKKVEQNGFETNINNVNLWRNTLKHIL